MPPGWASDLPQLILSWLRVILDGSYLVMASSDNLHMSLLSNLNGLGLLFFHCPPQASIARSVELVSIVRSCEWPHYRK